MSKPLSLWIEKSWSEFEESKNLLLFLFFTCTTKHACMHFQFCQCHQGMEWTSLTSVVDGALLPSSWLPGAFYGPWSIKLWALTHCLCSGSQAAESKLCPTRTSRGNISRSRLGREDLPTSMSSLAMLQRSHWYTCSVHIFKNFQKTTQLNWIVDSLLASLQTRFVRSILRSFKMPLTA